MNKEEKRRLETLSVPLGNWQITQCKGFFLSFFSPSTADGLSHCQLGTHLRVTGLLLWDMATGSDPQGITWKPSKWWEALGTNWFCRYLAPNPLASSMTSPTAFPINMWLSQRSFHRPVPDITLFLNDYRCCQNFNMRRNRKGNLTDWWEMPLDRIRGEHLTLHLPPSCINQYKKQELLFYTGIRDDWNTGENVL